MLNASPDSTDHVVGVLTEQIEACFGMRVDQLKAAVAAAPNANPNAIDVVKWYGLLLDSQAALERTEDDLVSALENQPSEVDDPTMGLAHRVNAAVTARDGRAMVVRWLLDPNAAGKQDASARQLARFRGRQGPAVPTSAPPQPATAPQPGRSLAR
ncbi:hypothetical protein BEK98_22360 [Streptomyces diastatochromogenes]|uniref:Uncharacterized protein n=2 Tax=Streptomyces diastatochromogenes TaxID=42236 RepID=A0A233SCV8_STRDA|nr:hypothetical protein [Streptomyces diastatochromogenes]OXY93483.1 hypothetical protein BEK98_22360 [Streptomyces diastatochromogenes]